MPTREQYISWAYGQCAIENPNVTRELATKVVDEMIAEGRIVPDAEEDEAARVKAAVYAFAHALRWVHQCGACHGSGWIPYGRFRETCKWCEGKGWRKP